MSERNQAELRLLEEQLRRMRGMRGPMNAAKKRDVLALSVIVQGFVFFFYLRRPYGRLMDGDGTGRRLAKAGLAATGGSVMRIGADVYGAGRTPAPALARARKGWASGTAAATGK